MVHVTVLFQVPVSQSWAVQNFSKILQNSGQLQEILCQLMVHLVLK